MLTWFERDPEMDLFERLRGIMDREDPTPRPVEILEVGEVIHHTPVYAIFLCEDHAALTGNLSFQDNLLNALLSADPT